ncbi:unnamed protein product [Rhodiola kirilowii]
MQSAKEAASNVAASAKAGMDKTKAVVQEKVDKMTAHDPTEKDMATQKKEEKITQVEINKQQARDVTKTKLACPGHTLIQLLGLMGDQLDCTKCPPCPVMELGSHWAGMWLMVLSGRIQLGNLLGLVGLRHIVPRQV